MRFILSLIICLMSIFVLGDQSLLKQYVMEWEKAVIAGDAKLAVTLSKKICKTEKQEIPTAYAELCQNNGLNPKYLNSEFNKLDFQYWNHAFFFSQLAKKIIKTEKNGNEIEKIFRVVCNNIKKKTAEIQGYTLWPYVIWLQKKGLCDRQSWVLSELAYQLGYETQIVYIRDKKGIPRHTICEIRKGTLKWLADPYARKLHVNKSVLDILKNKESRDLFMPNKFNLQESLNHTEYWLPSYPQDYCKRNQTLYSVFKSFFPENTVRFGEAPEERLMNYILLTTEDERYLAYQFWFYPFRLLRSQIINFKDDNFSKNFIIK